MPEDKIRAIRLESVANTCSQCGSQVDKGMNFCPKCGARIIQGSPQADMAPTDGSERGSQKADVGGEQLEEANS